MIKLSKDTLMIKKYIFIFLITIPSFLIAHGSFDSGIYQNMKGDSIKYRIHVPDNYNISSTESKYPLLLFFHGSGQRGSDNFLQLFGGPADILKIADRFNLDLFIIVPQCPGGQQWVNTPRDSAFHIMDKDASLTMDLSISLLDHLMMTLPVDKNRVYTAGFSMGGFAVWDILQRRPSTFAAAIPVCGGGDETLAFNLIDIPLWAFHGEDDKVVPPDRTRNMIRALRDSGGYPSYTEYKNTGHNSWTRTFTNDDVLSWLFNQKK
jgi:predicted peptidase